MIKGSCHCGAVSFMAPRKPDWLTDCNCSICRRIGAKWAHFTRREVEIEAPEDGTIAYLQGDRTLVTHSCKQCGCTTHWLGVDEDPEGRMAVNFRMCEPSDIDDIPVRHFDGADTWKFLD
jgi:hypothetical protein